MPIQTKISRGRVVRIDTAVNDADPVDGTTLPTFVMSPRTSTGLRTTGLALGLKAPSSGAAVPVAAGFSVALWVLNPLTWAWFAGATSSKGFNQLFSTFDVNASAIYVQFVAAGTSADGLVDFHYWEQ